MLRTLTTFFRLQARNVRTAKSKPEIQDEPKIPKKPIQFTEEELAEMTHRANTKRASVFKKFDEKIEVQKKSEKLSQEKPEEQNMGEDPSSFEMKTKKNIKEKFKTFKIYRRNRRVRVQKEGEPVDLKELSKVRLQQNFLPEEYMKKVQKIFHKYDQAMLRDIAVHFNKLMRLRYNEQKFDYEKYPDLGFKKLEEKLPKEKQVQQIYLASKEKIIDNINKQANARVEDDPIEPEISYSQNVIISYLLNRVPRTYATALRVLFEIKSKFPKFEPTSFIDFGSGLSSGSLAFTEAYSDTGMVYNVDPAAKMRKLSKFLTSHTKIQHYETLGELSTRVSQVDIVYVGYVLNELRPELVEVYLESLFAKVKNQGFLVLVESGNPFGSRLIHEARKWSLNKKSKIVAPCPHQMKCPLAKGNFWCHFDQPAGMYPREVFGKLPTDNSIKNQKFSYLIIQKQEAFAQGEPEIKITSNITQDWDRVIFPLIKKGRHFVFNLCTKSGAYERRVVGKSHGLEYKEGRKLRWGDLWRFGKRIPNRYRKERGSGKRLW